MKAYVYSHTMELIGVAEGANWDECTDKVVAIYPHEYVFDFFDHETWETEEHAKKRLGAEYLERIVSDPFLEGECIWDVVQILEGYQRQILSEYEEEEQC